MVKGEDRGRTEEESMEGGNQIRISFKYKFPGIGLVLGSSPVTQFSSAVFSNQLACFIFSLLPPVVSSQRFSPSLIFAEQIVLLYLLPYVCVSEE